MEMLNHCSLLTVMKLSLNGIKLPRCKRTGHGRLEKLPTFQQHQKHLQYYLKMEILRRTKRQLLKSNQEDKSMVKTPDFTTLKHETTVELKSNTKQNVTKNSTIK